MSRSGGQNRPPKESSLITHESSAGCMCAGVWLAEVRFSRLRFLLFRAVRCMVALCEPAVVGADEVQYCVCPLPSRPVCYFKTKYCYGTVPNVQLYLIENLSNCPGQKSAKFSGREIRKICISTSVVHAFSPKGPQTLRYFLFLCKCRVSRDYFTACLVELTTIWT
jgi:hypothetical protein